jgi:hypothetical protein
MSTEEKEFEQDTERCPPPDEAKILEEVDELLKTLPEPRFLLDDPWI